jgi:ammonia channel protein AmtB
MLAGMKGLLCFANEYYGPPPTSKGSDIPFLFFSTAFSFFIWFGFDHGQ